MEVERKIYEEVLKLPEDEQKEIEKVIDKVIKENYEILKELAGK